MRIQNAKNVKKKVKNFCKKFTSEKGVNIKEIYGYKIENIPLSTKNGINKRNAQYNVSSKEYSTICFFTPYFSLRGGFGKTCSNV